MINVGGDRFELAAGVGAFKYAVALFTCHHHAGTFLTCAPYHSVAGDQAVQIGAQVAANRFIVAIAHLKSTPEVSNDTARLFGTVFTGGELFSVLHIALFSALGTFRLDFLDAPLLLAT
ncbi:hypothetical protein HORIV_25180 [Vreelandella olivaria]|uniref:Uncharacterized protein n=1 Tax=Vreelandella olivaria TaxID=390919 RepID=A0ABN5WT79_9GAMM|nr:hypothetical protein HORIV_25180 [Halomonas olivaria]